MRHPGQCIHEWVVNVSEVPGESCAKCPATCRRENGKIISYELNAPNVESADRRPRRRASR